MDIKEAIAKAADRIDFAICVGNMLIAHFTDFKTLA